MPSGGRSRRRGARSLRGQWRRFGLFVLSGDPMALARQVMTDEQRKSVAVEYLKAFDNGGVTSSGASILDLFASDAQVYFPKWGLATGREQIAKLFGEVGATIKSITHHYSHFNWIFSGSDLLVCEGTSHGEHGDGPWRAGTPEWAAGRWCDVFEIRDWLIQRCFIYLDPDYAGKDTARYPWLEGKNRSWGIDRSLTV